VTAVPVGVRLVGQPAARHPEAFRRVIMDKTSRRAATGCGRVPASRSRCNWVSRLGCPA
jgi:hypothetical protein